MTTPISENANPGKPDSAPRPMPRAMPKKAVDAFHRRRPPLGGKVTVLAGATSAEEFVEGITIGVGAAIGPGAALIVGIGILVDNFAEALSIGELLREEEKQRYRREIMKWTGIIGLSLFVSAMIGWFLLHDLPDRYWAFCPPAAPAACSISR